MPAAAVDAVTDEHIPQSASHDVPDPPAKATSRGPDIGYLHDMSMAEATLPVRRMLNVTAGGRDG
jgi:hypothetical protein